MSFTLTVSGVDNYTFCAGFAQQIAAGRKQARVLDYGCGNGQIVESLRREGIEAFGCDTFYEGGTYQILPDAAAFVLPMNSTTIPFPDCHFDAVTNNQVMEHVADLNTAVREIARVLKPGGTVLSIFPDNKGWREGHCGIPFVHRLPRRFRVPYAFAMRCAGFGNFTEGKSRLQWARDFCDWIDKWCYYRPYDEIAATFERHLGPMQHIEADWIVARRANTRFAPRWMRRFITRKCSGMVFLCKKPERRQTKNDRPEGAVSSA